MTLSIPKHQARDLPTNMSAQYLNLPALPFEFLLCACECLDRNDLLSVCLASKALNSVATPLLYRTIHCRVDRSNYLVSLIMLYSCTIYLIL